MQLIGWYFDMEATNIYSPGGRPSGYPADWMLLTTNRAFLKKNLIAEAAIPEPVSDKQIRTWTDDYSELFQVLKV